MKKRIKLLSVFTISVVSLFLFTSCPEYIALGSLRFLYLQFENTEGENILSTVELNLIHNDYLEESQYSLTMKGDGREYKPDKISLAKFEGVPVLEFITEKFDHVQTKKIGIYKYEYRFSCPAIFGDDKEHIIQAEIDNSKGAQTRFYEAYFDGKKCDVITPNKYTNVFKIIVAR